MSHTCKQYQMQLLCTCRKLLQEAAMAAVRRHQTVQQSVLVLGQHASYILS
jgi:hypothetical protein